jgi:hypothetical protein
MMCPETLLLRLAEQANQMVALASTQPLPDKFFLPPPPEPEPLALEPPADVSAQLRQLGLPEALAVALSRAHLASAERLIEDCKSRFTHTCRSLPLNFFDTTHTSLREAQDACRQSITNMFVTTMERQRQFLFLHAQENTKRHHTCVPSKPVLDPQSPPSSDSPNLYARPSYASIPRKKSRSAPFNSYITSMLEQAWIRTPFPSVGDKRKLANALGLQLKQVSVWVRL